VFKPTTAVSKILNMRKRIKGIQGGTSAGKTIANLMIEIDYACKVPMTETSVVAESVPHLKRGAMKDFIKIMKSLNRWHSDRWNSTDSKYTFHNGSYIEFFSGSDDDKLRGARRDRLFMNEANNMTFHAYTELASRTKKSVTLDWNPTNKFWFHEEVMGDEDVDFIILNHEDNEECPESAKEFILKAQKKAETSKYWQNWYNVYGLGLIGNLEGVVFENWDKIDKIPDEARLLGYGMDFGFTNDPTTMVACYKWRDRYIFDEVIYQKGLHNSEIARLIKANPKGNVYADQAEPKSIDEIKRHGINISGATKGADSIAYGISLLQEKDFLITKSSENLIKELRNYTWITDKTGKNLNKPIDAYNHCIDAMRYFAIMNFTNKKRTISIKT
jgi:phage terminase large subunit